MEEIFIFIQCVRERVYGMRRPTFSQTFKWCPDDREHMAGVISINNLHRLSPLDGKDKTFAYLN